MRSGGGKIYTFATENKKAMSYYTESLCEKVI